MRERAIGLAVGDLASHQAGAVLRCRDLEHAARVQDGDDQRLQFHVGGLGEGCVEDLAGDVEREFSHGWNPLQWW